MTLSRAHTCAKTADVAKLLIVVVVVVVVVVV